MARRYSVQANGLEVISFDDPVAAKGWSAVMSKTTSRPFPKKKTVAWVVMDMQTHTPVS